MMKHTGLTVLIVDDAPDTRHNVRRLLGLTLGVDVVGEAANAEDAIKKIGQLSPQIVLMDVNMPGIDGITATARITSTYPDTIVIVMSVQGETEYLRRAMIAGAKDYLVKPFGADELADCIQKAWERESVRRAKVPVGHGSKPDGQVIAVFSPKGGVGKTTLAVNLAAVLATERKAKVCVVDLSLQFGDVCVFLGLVPRRTLSDLVSESTLEAKVMEPYFMQHPSGVKVLPAPISPEYAEYVVPDHIVRILAVCRTLFDYVIVDMAASFADTALATLDAADKVLLLGNMDMASLKNMKISLELMQRLGYSREKVFLILNQAGYDYGIRFGDLEAALSRKVDFYIHHDDIPAMLSANRGTPIALDQPDSKLAKRYRELVNEHIAPKQRGEEAVSLWRRRQAK
ncbi:MAG: response regulator [Selenomonadales bacterium]|jgi:pilus assembly protein CpaE|nr:response regulator [Selenomonadales bacterium]